MGDRRQAVLDVLRSAGSPMSIADLAQGLDVHPNTVRFHLRALTGSGRVERVPPTRTSPGRPPLMFRVRPGMDPAGPRHYRQLADALASHMEVGERPTHDATEAGRAWGMRMAGPAEGQASTDDEGSTDRLVEVLDELGFSPRRARAEGRTQIELRHCPFLELVPKHQPVVCRVHLGLMQGVLTALGSTQGVARLEPLVEPDLCLASLDRTGVAS